MNTLLAKLWRFFGFTKKIQLFFMRFMQDEFLIGLTGIIFNDTDQVLLVKHSYRQTPWSLPGGYLKAKEHPAEGLEREIKEETGFTVTIDKQLKVRTDRTTGRLDMCYLGTFIGGRFEKSQEVIDYGFFSVDNLPLILKDQVIFIYYALKKWQEMKKTMSFFQNTQSVKKGIPIQELSINYR